MSKHTKESWKWERKDETGYVTVWTLNGPDVLCRFWHDRPPSHHARLIAAAPDLEYELGGIADALAAGDTVTIEPGSVKAERIRVAVAAAVTAKKAEGKL